MNLSKHTDTIIIALAITISILLIIAALNATTTSLPQTAIST